MKYLLFFISLFTLSNQALAAQCEYPIFAYDTDQNKYLDLCLALDVRELRYGTVVTHPKGPIVDDKRIPIVAVDPETGFFPDEYMLSYDQSTKLRVCKMIGKEKIGDSGMIGGLKQPKKKLYFNDNGE